MGFKSLLKSGLSHHNSGDDLKPDPAPEDGDSSVHSRSSSFSTDFLATSQLQVQAVGYDMNQAISGKTLENITVYREESGEPKYISVRLKRSSNSCALVHASDLQQNTLVSTIYRWGPGRHPRMHIFDSSVSVEDAINETNECGEQIEVQSRSLVSRAQIFDTSLGKFKWRYGSREERKANDADSLLVLERVDHGAQVALLIRNDQFRTPGSARYSGGNGGRLVTDLRLWHDDKKEASMEAFVVASCILMLKREADRFINNNVAAVV